MASSVIQSSGRRSYSQIFDVLFLFQRLDARWPMEAPCLLAKDLATHLCSLKTRVTCRCSGFRLLAATPTLVPHNPPTSRVRARACGVATPHPHPRGTSRGWIQSRRPWPTQQAALTLVTSRSAWRGRAAHQHRGAATSGPGSSLGVPDIPLPLSSCLLPPPIC